MAQLTRDTILAVQDLKIQKVEIPEWGGPEDFIFVRGMTGAERDEFEAEVATIRGRKIQTNYDNIRAKLAAFTICDETGKRLFSESDVAALGNKSASALQRVFLVAQLLSGINESAIQEMTENLTENPFVPSPSS